MSQVTLAITPALIEAGLARDAEECPIAIAVRRHFNPQFVLVKELTTEVVTGTHVLTFAHHVAIVEWIKIFDRDRRSVKPIRICFDSGTFKAFIVEEQ